MDQSSEEAVAAKEQEVMRLRCEVNALKQELQAAARHSKTCVQLLHMAMKHDGSEAVASNLWYSDEDVRRIRAQEIESLDSLKQEHEDFRATIARQKNEIEHLQDDRTALTEIRSTVCGNLDRHTQQRL